MSNRYCGMLSWERKAVSAQFQRLREGNEMKMRVEIAVYNQAISFVLPSNNAADCFYYWWVNQATLPQGGSLICRADKENDWRHLERLVLTDSQKMLIGMKLIELGGEVEKVAQ